MWRSTGLPRNGHTTYDQDAYFCLHNSDKREKDSPEFGIGFVPCVRPNSLVYSVGMDYMLDADDLLLLQCVDVASQDHAGFWGLRLSESLKDLAGDASVWANS